MQVTVRVCTRAVRAIVREVGEGRAASARVPQGSGVCSVCTPADAGTEEGVTRRQVREGGGEERGSGV